MHLVANRYLGLTQDEKLSSLRIAAHTLSTLKKYTTWLELAFQMSANYSKDNNKSDVAFSGRQEEFSEAQRLYRKML